MGKLFLFETRKLARQKSVYICLAVAVALIALSALTFAFVDKFLESRGEDLSAVMGVDYMFYVGNFTKNAFSNCEFFLLLGVIITLFCCGDYSNGTIKNIYAKGYSRTKVYFAKYLISLILSLVFAALCIVISYAIGAIFAKQDNCGQLAAVVICQLFTVIGYHGIFFSVSMMLGKTGGSLAINILAPMFLGMILELLTMLVRAAAKGGEFDCGYIWFDSVYRALGEIPVKTEAFLRAVLMSIIYAGGFVTLGYFVNRRKEV